MADGPTRPSDATIKRLFARSGNRCAYPRCPLEIVQGDVVVGEVCHIRGSRPDSPRHDPAQSPSARHGYDNLILLCRNHHKVIDDDPEAYTVERLLRMRADHESRPSALAPGAIERAVRLLIDQSVVSVNQSGGITAHTVHQTIHVHPAGPAASAPPREAILSVLREFHRGRVDAIAAGKAPLAVLDRGILALHVLPFSTAGDRQAPSFDEIGQNPHRFPPVKGSVQHTRIDYEGLLIGSNREGLSEPQRAYVTVARNGYVESVVSSLARLRDHRFLSLADLGGIVVGYACQYASALDACGVEPPYAVLVSLLDVKERQLLQGPFPTTAFPEDLPSATLTRARYEFGECVLESDPKDEQQCATRLRPVLDHLANAAGLATSPCFDADGGYSPARGA